MHPSASRKAGSTAEQSRAQRVTLDAVAGALAGCVSRFLVGPLDVIKIRFQVQLEPINISHSTPTKRPSYYKGFIHAFRTIVKEEGVRVSRCVHCRSARGVYVTACHGHALYCEVHCKTFTCPTCNSLSFSMRFMHSICCSALFAAGEVTSTSVCALQGLWAGTVPGLLLTIPYTAVQFVALQQCKETAARLGWQGMEQTLCTVCTHTPIQSAARLANINVLSAQDWPKQLPGSTTTTAGCQL
eukprot:GHRR01032741.1.p1 GENE.GHRR01032741.1~~GHRR01032741.1.p1  ORF type:complete len:243 (-),score=27.63 GHRR01032741.1:225-953(-)